MTRGPTILSTRTVTSSRLFKVEEVGLRFANGQQVSYERLAGHSGSVLVVPITADDGLLLIREYAVGFEHVLINGQPVIAHGEHTGALPGKMLRQN